MEEKLKHLEFIQGAIARMATNSFLFKGWAITLASALGGVAAVNDRRSLVLIALATTALFWGLDGYYLWLERGFIKLHKRVAAQPEADVDFSMEIDRTDAGLRWLQTCLRPHLYAFYGVILVVEVIATFGVGGK